MSDLADALDAVLFEQDQDDEPVELRDEAHVDRMLALLCYLQRRAAKIEAVAEERLRPIVEWRDEELRKLTNREQSVRRAVDGWIRGVHERDERVKTVKLPHGEVRIRPVQSTVLVDDVEKLARWLELNGYGDLVVREPRVARSELKRRLFAGTVTGSEPGSNLCKVQTEDGEVVPGATFVVPTHKSVTVGLAKLAAVTGPGDNASDSSTEPQGDSDE